MIPYLVAATLMTAIAAVIDYRTENIPNWLTLPPLAAAPLAHAIQAGARGGMREALWALAYAIAGAVICALVPLLMYRASAIGGGDVKIFAALGALCFPMIGMEAETYGFVAAALIAPARLAYQGKLWKTLGNSARIALNPFLPKSKRKELDQEAMTWFRMGPAIFLGTAAALVSNWR